MLICNANFFVTTKVAKDTKLGQQKGIER